MKQSCMTKNHLIKYLIDLILGYPDWHRMWIVVVGLLNFHLNWFMSLSHFFFISHKRTIQKYFITHNLQNWKALFSPFWTLDTTCFSWFQNINTILIFKLAQQLYHIDFFMHGRNFYVVGVVSRHNLQQFSEWYLARFKIPTKILA